ncbi:CD8A protein, partial [Bucco capensis]|nr:CD8A protein [Bucco capensis]
ARPAPLLLLALGLGCSGIHGHRDDVNLRMLEPVPIHAQEGKPLQLRCVSSKEDFGVFWIHQDKAGTLHFIVFISSSITFAGKQQASQRYAAWKNDKSFWLKVNSFQPQDEGNYFCVANINRQLYFSPGQPAFLP